MHAEPSGLAHKDDATVAAMVQPQSLGATTYPAWATWQLPRFSKLLVYPDIWRLVELNPLRGKIRTLFPFKLSFGSRSPLEEVPLFQKGETSVTKHYPNMPILW